MACMYPTAGESHSSWLFNHLINNIVELKELNEFSSQNLANTAWAYVVANAVFPSLFDSNFISACLEKGMIFLRRITASSSVAIAARGATQVRHNCFCYSGTNLAENISYRCSP